MATMIERKEASIRKEIEKLEKSLARYTGIYEKKRAKAEKVGAADWSHEEFRERIDNNTITREQDEAWFNLYCAKRDVDDVVRRLENANKRLARVIPKVETVKAEKVEAERIEAIESGVWTNLTKSAEERQAEYEKWFKEFKAECKKDGIEIEEASANYVSGKTTKGEFFVLYLNNGVTSRSWHCYTLRVNGYTIFTSGEFGTAYNVIRQK